MSIVLRGYQHDDIQKIRASYASGHRAPLYVGCCGSGKTIMFAAICAGAAARGNRVLLLAHRTELLDQISSALSDAGCEHGYLAASYPFHADNSACVASVFTAARRIETLRPDLIIVDEAHHAIPSTSWGRVLGAYPRAKILGVTATPIRTNGQGLDDIFDDLIVGPDHEELIRLGYLTPCAVYAPSTPDVSGLKTRGGDFDTAGLVELIDRPKVTGDCIAHYRRIAPGARAVVFDVSIEAARRRAAAFREAGFTAECIFGETERSVRALAVADFRAGRVQILVSVDLISEGFDLPAIEVGICLRPTQSLTLWLQQSGRVLRPLPGKSRAILLDHAGNTLRHGLPTEVRTWSLAGVVEMAKRGEPRRSLRTCPACFAVSLSGAVECRACGHVFPVTPREVHEVQGTLEELTAEKLALRRQRKEQGRSRSYHALVELGRQRGMKHPDKWAQHVLAARARKARIG